jgi:hypothetical protein
MIIHTISDANSWMEHIERVRLLPDPTLQKLATGHLPFESNQSASHQVSGKSSELSNLMGRWAATFLKQKENPTTKPIQLI